MEIWDGNYIPKELVEMEVTLTSAGLQVAPKELIDRRYFFAAQWGGHHQELVGTIEAIETSDEGPPLLVVSNRRFWGKRLIGLAFDGKDWCAYIDVMEVNERFIPGQLILLA